MALPAAGDQGLGIEVSHQGFGSTETSHRVSPLLVVKVSLYYFKCVHILADRAEVVKRNFAKMGDNGLYKGLYR